MVTTSTISSATQRTNNAAAPEKNLVVSLLRAGVAQTPGQRDSQEDAVDINIPAEPKLVERGSLFVLAEGAGLLSLQSHNGKAVARSIREAFYSSFCFDAGRALRSAFVSTNRTLHKQSSEKLGTTRSGVLCVAAAVQGEKLWLAGAGDALVYLFNARSGELLKITLGEEKNNDRLGMVPDIEPSLKGPYRLSGGDMLLISSDGLFSQVPLEAVEYYMKSATQTTPALPATQVATALVNAARFRSAPDNATALVLRCHGVLPLAAAAEYGWPTGYVTSLSLPGEGEPPQQSEPYPTVYSLAAKSLRPALPQAPQPPVAAAPVPVAAATPAPQAPVVDVVAPVMYAPAAAVAAIAAPPEVTSIKPFRQKRGAKKVVAAVASAPQAAASNRDTIDLTTLAEPQQPAQPQTRRQRFAAHIPGWARACQRGLGWIVTTGSLVPLVAALFIQERYLTSPEGLFFLGLAASGSLCSMQAAIAQRRSRPSLGKPSRRERRRKGSASVAAQRLGLLQPVEA